MLLVIRELFRAPIFGSCEEILDALCQYIRIKDDLAIQVTGRATGGLAGTITGALLPVLGAVGGSEGTGGP